MVVSGDGIKELAKKHDIKASFHFVSPNGAMLAEVLGDIAQAKVKPASHVVQSVKLAARLQDESEAHHTRGKVVLAIDF